MMDNAQDIEALIQELESLRSYVAELEKEKLMHYNVESEKILVEHSLRERVKELNCLYGLAELIEKHGQAIENILQGVAFIIPESWQYPEITCAKITFEDSVYSTVNFKPSRWRQSAVILVEGKPSGTIDVCYLKKMPDIDEGPFLKEERLLINALAERTGLAIESIRSKKQLQLEQEALKNMNITLKEVLTTVQDEKKAIGEAIRSNVNKIITPIVHAIEADAPGKQKKLISLLKKNLDEITSPFAGAISRDFMSLSPTEIQICNMIKNGLSSKEIARIRGNSPATVNRHREHIRKKLGIAHSSINLVTFLDSYMSTADGGLRPAGLSMDIPD